MSPFQELEHTADWAFRVEGRDLKELFANAAHALASLEAWPTTGCTHVSTRELTQEIEVSGFDRETLLVNWLNELLYLCEKECASPRTFEILELTDTRLKARVQSKGNGTTSRKIKSVTFHGLRIKQCDQGWEATITV